HAPRHASDRSGFVTDQPRRYLCQCRTRAECMVRLVHRTDRTGFPEAGETFIGHDLDDRGVQVLNISASHPISAFSNRYFLAVHSDLFDAHREYQYSLLRASTDGISRDRRAM